jgi:hypothetical protein
MDRGNTVSRQRWPSWLNASALLVASFLAIAVLSLQARPGAEIVAVAFPPWWSSQEAFLAAAAADAAIVRMTAIPSLLVVRPDQHDGLARLRNAGVWLALDPRAIDGCFSINSLGTGNDYPKR